MKVLTIKGLIDFDKLNVKDIVEVGDNHRKVATEWYLEDELVRRSVAVEMLRPAESAAEQGNLNG
jgi:hypothetical protein